MEECSLEAMTFSFAGSVTVGKMMVRVCQEIQLAMNMLMIDVLRPKINSC